jgi:hypothetical protein
MLALATTSSDLNIMNGGVFLKAATAANLNRTAVDPRHFTLSKRRGSTPLAVHRVCPVASPSPVSLSGVLRRNTWAVDVLRRAQVLNTVALAQLPADELFRTMDLTSCAVVGSAAGLKGKGAGRAIDAHTAVFRFNEAPTVSYEKDVGTAPDCCGEIVCVRLRETDV